jgi:hypothetical protein
MEISLGDLADRYSILKLKLERTDAPCQKEFDDITRELKASDNLKEFLDKLYVVNGKIWDLESDIRKGKEEILGLEEVGRRAIAIRNLNNLRVALKNEINTTFNSGYIEYKRDHASE